MVAQVTTPMTDGLRAFMGIDPARPGSDATVLVVPPQAFHDPEFRAMARRIYPGVEIICDRPFPQFTTGEPK